MKDLEKVSKNYKKLVTSKDKICYLEKEKYILNFSALHKNNDIVFRCKYYQNQNIKCKAHVIFYKDEKIVSYNNEHTCAVNEEQVKEFGINEYS